MFPRTRSSENHYLWGDRCDGWRLLDGPDLAVVAERVPPGAAEVRHRHARARQLFYILSGAAVLELDGARIALSAGQAIEVAPLSPHRFVNESDAPVEFLVISAPSTRGDRIEDPEAE